MPQLHCGSGLGQKLVLCWLGYSLVVWLILQSDTTWGYSIMAVVYFYRNHTWPKLPPSHKIPWWVFLSLAIAILVTWAVPEATELSPQLARDVDFVFWVSVVIAGVVALVDDVFVFAESSNLRKELRQHTGHSTSDTLESPELASSDSGDGTVEIEEVK